MTTETPRLEKQLDAICDCVFLRGLTEERFNRFHTRLTGKYKFTSREDPSKEIELRAETRVYRADDGSIQSGYTQLAAHYKNLENEAIILVRRTLPKRDLEMERQISSWPGFELTCEAAVEQIYNDLELGERQ